MENAVIKTWDIYKSKGLENKPIDKMTLAEKGLLLQLEISNPFKGEDLFEPNNNMTPEDKGALLLRYIHEKQPLYKNILNENPEIGEDFFVINPIDFSGINLNILGLMNSNLSHANFKGAIARDANLIDVNLDETSLEGADIEGCHLSGATLRGCNLKNYKGFPYQVRDCIIDVETYRKSEWSPEILAKWHHAGAIILSLDKFPNNAIEAILGDFNKTSKPEVFISYGGCDSEIATLIAEHLEKRGIRVWFAAWDIDYGEDIVRSIETGLESTNTFIIVLSPEALERDWVRQELSSAYYQALSGPGKQIIPIMYKKCKLPAFIRTKKWLDFKIPYIKPLEELTRAVRKKAIKRGEN